MNSEMKLALANVVKEFMDDEREFSNYDVFCEARKQNNWNFRYMSVRDEVRDIIRKAVSEVGNYLSKFKTNSKGNIYLVYYLNNEFPDYADELNDDFNDDLDENLIRAADPEYNRNEDFSDEIDDDYSNEDTESSISEYNVCPDDRGRIYITKTHMLESGLKSAKQLFASYFDNKKELIISDKPIVDADDIRILKNTNNGNGLYITLNKYFNTYVCIRSSKNIIKIFI